MAPTSHGSSATKLELHGLAAGSRPRNEDEAVSYYVY